MARWLFNSRGQGVAFVVGSNVFLRDSNFLGQLNGNEIWNSRYVGEIIDDERVARRTVRPLGVKGLPGLPGVPGLPGLPGLKGSRMLPLGFEDID